MIRDIDSVVFNYWVGCIADTAFNGTNLSESKRLLITQRIIDSILHVFSLLESEVPNE